MFWFGQRNALRPGHRSGLYSVHDQEDPCRRPGIDGLRHRFAALPRQVAEAVANHPAGGIAYPILFRQLQPRIGFGWTVRTIAFIALAITAVALAFLRPIPRSPGRRKMFQIRAWTEIPFAFFSLALFLGFLAFWIPFVYVPTYALLSLDSSEDLAFYMLCVVNAGSFFGRIVPAIIAQKFGPMQVFIVATMSCSVLLFAWIGIHDLTGFFVFSALFGFCSGVLVSVPPATIPHPVLSPSLDVVGTRLGMCWSMTGMGVLVGSPIAGAFIDTSSKDVSFFGAQVFAGSCMAAAAIVLAIPCMAIIRHDKRRDSDVTHVDPATAIAGLEVSGAVSDQGFAIDEAAESRTEHGSESHAQQVDKVEEDGDSQTVRVEDPDETRTKHTNRDSMPKSFEGDTSAGGDADSIDWAGKER